MTIHASDRARISIGMPVPVPAPPGAHLATDRSSLLLHKAMEAARGAALVARHLAGAANRSRGNNNNEHYKLLYSVQHLFIAEASGQA